MYTCASDAVSQKDYFGWKCREKGKADEIRGDSRRKHRRDETEAQWRGSKEEEAERRMKNQGSMGLLQIC